jgi:hypothetical protein
MFARRLLIGALLAALFAAPWISSTRAMEFGLSGYGDIRAISSPDMQSWVNGGLEKFRFGGNEGNVRFVEAIAQGVVTFDDTFSAIAVIRAEPEQRAGLDALEAYVSVHPASDGDITWSAKLGAFYPTISLENDDIGWTSPYTLTPSAINTWIGEELRTIGGEGNMRWRTPDLGTITFTGALFGGNDPAGVLIADRGWAMDDRPTGLFEHVREPDTTMKIFHAPYPARTGLFDEIDHRAGWYLGLSWQMAGIGKVSALRYDNQGDPNADMDELYAWDTKFWAFGARTQFDDLVLISQYLAGFTSIQPDGMPEIVTKFQSAFLLASYDLNSLGFTDWRASLRGDYFQTRHIAATPNAMSEDGDALTVALSWQGLDWLKITGEALLMHSRKGEYKLEGVPSGALGQAEYQLDAKIFF